MFHRSRVASRLAERRAELTNGLGSIMTTPVRPGPPPQSLGIDQLVPALIEAGAERRYQLQLDKMNGVIRIMAIIGPIAIPLDLNAAEARVLAAGIMGAADMVDPPAEQPLDPYTSPDPYRPPARFQPEPQPSPSPEPEDEPEDEPEPEPKHQPKHPEPKHEPKHPEPKHPEPKHK